MDKKHLAILSVVVAVCGLAVILASAQEQNGPIKKAINKLDDKAAQAVQTIENRTSQAVQTIETKANEFVNPPAHVPGQSGLPLSATRGTGRLLRNMTVEGGRLVGTVAKGLLKFTRKTAGALATTARESGSRLLNGRRPPPPAPINIVVQSVAEPSVQAQPQPEAEATTSTTTEAATTAAAASESATTAETSTKAPAPATTSQAPAAAPAEPSNQAEEKPASA